MHTIFWTTFHLIYICFISLSFVACCWLTIKSYEFLFIFLCYKTVHSWGKFQTKVYLIIVYCAIQNELNMITYGKEQKIGYLCTDYHNFDTHDLKRFFLTTLAHS